MGLSLAAAALSIAAIAGSIAHIGRGFPGFIVWDNLVVVALGRPGWSGIAAEVPFRSRVVAVDDHTVRSRGELTARLEAQPVGTVHAYTFETVEGREARAVPSMIFTLGDYVATMGVYALNGLVFLVAGLAVFYLKPESRQARALLAFGVVYGLMAVVCVDLFTAGRLDPVYFIVQGLCPAALLHLALTFPEPRRPVKRSGRMLGWLYGAGLAAGLLEVALYRRSYSAL
ncbi:MAG TPA: hypothetical protein VGJ70_00900, partial [Solirubrobacteraceae bacterium]